MSLAQLELKSFKNFLNWGQFGVLGKKLLILKRFDYLFIKQWSAINLPEEKRKELLLSEHKVYL